MKQWWIIILLITVCPLKADNIFIEAESFDKKGGWVLDNPVSYTHLYWKIAETEQLKDSSYPRQRIDIWLK